MWEDAVAWLLRLGDEYGVDPVIYAIIYVGALPFFLASLGWLVRTIARRRPMLPPLLSTAFFFLAPTLYVLIAGRNLPAWVYLALLLLAVLGAVTTIRTVRSRVRQTGPPG